LSGGGGSVFAVVTEGEIKKEFKKNMSREKKGKRKR